MCRRTFCPDCDQEMIHRDHRKSYESASALGQIIHRQGPKQVTVGDLDLYCAKWFMSKNDPCIHGVLRLLEHKQSGQAIGALQKSVLTALHEIFDIAINNPSAKLQLDPRSGVYIIRGPIGAATSARREVDFENKQLISNIDGTINFAPRTRNEFYEWLNCGPGWEPRHNQGRYGG